jgi:hypothetical protein
MEFVATDGQTPITRAVKARRPCRPNLKTWKDRRDTRDRAILLLRKAGMTPKEISEAVNALSRGKPVLSMSQIYRVLQRLERRRQLVQRDIEYGDIFDDPHE